MFLIERADAWSQNWIKNGSNSWEEFMMSICNRFGEQGIEDIVEEFRQENFVVEYQDVFEGLRV